MRWSFMTLVLPGVRAGIPAETMTRSPARAQPRCSSTFSPSRIACRKSEAKGGTSRHSTPHTSESCCQVRLSGVIATRGTAGRFWAIRRAVLPVTVKATMQRACRLCAEAQTASATAASSG